MQLIEQTKELQTYIQKNTNPQNIGEEEAQNIYQNFIDCITDHNHLYYIESKPIISDKEYDDLFSYLKKIEEYYPHLISSDSPTQKLINQIQEGFKKAEHTAPMLSLENSYNSQDLREWKERITRILKKEDIQDTPTYIIEPKFDGLSIELIYKDGIFTKAITRGDGLIGEDVTENAKTIKNIPKKLKQEVDGTIAFRGEILITKSELEKINTEREKQGLTVYANTRNLASGSLKQLDPNITASRNLQCYIYDILTNCHSEQSEESSIKKTKTHILDSSLHSEGQLSLKNLGLPIHQGTKQVNNVDDIIKICEDTNIQQKFQQEDIEFDGLVIKVKEEKLRNIIGSTAHHPRWAIAYKFPAQQVSTQITSVDFQVGRTGIVTPVANLNPVQLSGATISRVSLHNFDFIKNKDIHHNDAVWIQRSGEVIPYIVGTIKERRKSESQKILPPTHCPVCAHEITNIDIHYYCPNPECPAQIKQKIIYFVSKNAMDIEGIGESIIDILVDQNIVHNIADLYNLLDFETERIVRRFPGFADKKITEIKKQLEATKTKPFWRLLNGLGIPGIGKKTAQDIEKALLTVISSEGNESIRGIAKQERMPWGRNPSIRKRDLSTSVEMTKGNLQKISTHLTDQEFLINIYGIGEKIIEGIITYFKTYKDLLEQLENIGLNFSLESDSPLLVGETGDEVKGASFCITGSFDIPRPKIIETMEQQGYRFDSSPTQNTTHMLVGSKPGSKLTKAEESGTKIISGWEEITKTFDFLKNIKNKEKKKGPEQMGLF